MDDFFSVDLFNENISSLKETSKDKQKESILPVMQSSAFCVKSPIPHTLAIFIGKIIPTAQRLNGWTMIQS